MRKQKSGMKNQKKFGIIIVFMLMLMLMLIASVSAYPEFYEFGMNSTFTGWIVLNNDTCSGVSGTPLQNHVSDTGMEAQWKFGSWSGLYGSIYDNHCNVSDSNNYGGIEINLTSGINTFNKAGQSYAVCFIYNTSTHTNTDLGLGGTANSKYSVRFQDYSGKFSNITAALYDWDENKLYRICYDIKRNEGYVRAVVIGMGTDWDAKTYTSVLYDSGYIFNFTTGTDANASVLYFRENSATIPYLVDNILIFNSTIPTPVPPILTVTSPANWTNFNTTSVYMNLTDSSPTNVSCILYDDAGGSMHTFNFTSNTRINFTATGEGTTYYNVTCYNADGSDTERWVYYVDESIPSCTPTDAVSLKYNMNYSWNMTCTDNILLYSLNVSCEGGTNFTLYLENINQTEYNFTNNTGYLNQSMGCQIITKDAHTDIDISDELNPYTVSAGTKITVKGLDIITFRNVSDIKKIKLDFTPDRVKFDIDMDKSITGYKEIIFYVSGKDKVSEIKNGMFPGWFVIDDHYWVDFSLENDDGMTYINSYRINDTTYAVSVYTMLDKLKFRSVGIINTNVQTKQFIVLDTGEFTIGVCPDTIPSAIIFSTICAIMMFLLFIGFAASDTCGIFGSIMMVVLSWYTAACIGLVGYVMAGLGLVLLLYFSLRD